MLNVNGRESSQMEDSEEMFVLLNDDLCSHCGTVCPDAFMAILNPDSREPSCNVKLKQPPIASHELCDRKQKHSTHVQQGASINTTPGRTTLCH
jgi:hypothetical protein